MNLWTSRPLEHFRQIQKICHKVYKRSSAKTTVVGTVTDPSVYVSMI